MGKPEGQVENYLKKQSEKNNILCYKFTSPSQNGVPDRILIGNGYTVFVELKAKDEEPRKLQEKVIEQMRNHGAIVYVIDNKEDIDRLIEFMTRFNT